MDLHLPSDVKLAEGNAYRPEYLDEIVVSWDICRKLSPSTTFASFPSFSNALSIALTFCSAPIESGSHSRRGIP
jgi:hypothetical protein